MYVVQKLELGRTEMEAWQNRIGKLEALQKIICMTGRTAWQKKMVQQQQYGRTHGTLAGRNFGRKGLNFGRMKLLELPMHQIVILSCFFHFRAFGLEVLQLILASKLGDPV